MVAVAELTEVEAAGAACAKKKEDKSITPFSGMQSAGVKASSVRLSGSRAS